MNNIKIECNFSDEYVIDRLKPLNETDKLDLITKALKIGLYALEDNDIIQKLTQLESELLVDLHHLANRMNVNYVKESAPIIQGVKFEDSILGSVQRISSYSQDLCEDVSRLSGFCGSKVGDTLITLKGGLGKIIIESKTEKNYTPGKTIKELTEACSNRGAQIGIMVFNQSSWAAPLYWIDDHTLACVVDGNDLSLEVAYRLARSLLENKRGKNLDVLPILNRIIIQLNQVANFERQVTNAKNILSTMWDDMNIWNVGIRENIKEIEKILNGN